MARNPLHVDSGVWSGVSDGQKVFDNLEGDVLSGGRVWFGASSNCGLVVDKDPDCVGVGVVLNPLSGISSSLEDSK